MARKTQRRQRHRFRVRAAPVGVPPGTLLPRPHAAPGVVRVIAYGPDGLVEHAVRDTAEIEPLLKQWAVTWVDVEGVGDVDLIARIGRIFGLHALALEDVVNLHQRAKVEDYHDHCFIVAHIASLADFVSTEQVSVFLGRGFVLTFQEGKPGDCFESVRQRIREGRGRLRRSGADLLAYALLDGVVDGYFPLLEKLGDRLDTIEDEIIVRPAARPVQHLHELKRDLLCLRRTIWPLRDALNGLIRDESALIGDEARVYLRDCYDHCVRILDLVEIYRELSADLIDLYLSSVSNRMNEIMKILTIFSTIFNPLTFIAGIYGMNFRPDASPLNMPELSWYWGYPFALTLMFVVAASFLIFFWRKGWIRSAPGPLDAAPAGQPRP